MNRESFYFQVTNAKFLIAASISASLPLLFGPRLENWLGGMGSALMFLLVALSIFLFIKAIRPITILLLPDGLQLGEQHTKGEDIVHVELNERYRQFGLKTSGTKGTTYYYLKRKTDLPHVRQALQEWAEHTGVTVQLKNSWR